MKYEIVTENSIIKNNIEYQQIRNIKTGELGGYVDSHNLLGQDGECWVYPNCFVDSSFVLENSKVKGNVILTTASEVKGNSTLHGNITCSISLIDGETYITGNSIMRYCVLIGNIRISGLSVLVGSKVYGNLISDGRFYLRSSIIVTRSGDVIKLPSEVVIVEGSIEKQEELEYNSSISILGSKGVTIYPGIEGGVLVAFRPGNAKNFKDVMFFDALNLDNFLAKHNIGLSDTVKQEIEKLVQKVANARGIKLPSKEQNGILNMCLGVENLYEAVSEQLRDIMVSYTELTKKNNTIKNKDDFARFICNYQHFKRVRNELTVPYVFSGIDYILKTYKITYKVRQFREVSLNGNKYKIPTVAFLSREILHNQEGCIYLFYDKETNTVSAKGYASTNAQVRPDGGFFVSEIDLRYLDYVYMQILKLIKNKK